MTSALCYAQAGQGDHLSVCFLCLQIFYELKIVTCLLLSKPLNTGLFAMYVCSRGHPNISSQLSTMTSWKIVGAAKPGHSKYCSCQAIVSQIIQKVNLRYASLCLFLFLYIYLFILMWIRRKKRKKEKCKHNSPPGASYSLIGSLIDHMVFSSWLVTYIAWKLAGYRLRTASTYLETRDKLPRFMHGNPKRYQGVMRWRRRC